MVLKWGLEHAQNLQKLMNHWSPWVNQSVGLYEVVEGADSSQAVNLHPQGKRCLGPQRPICYSGQVPLPLIISDLDRSADESVLF